MGPRLISYFEAQSHGLRPHYTRLRTPRCRDTRGFATVLPGSGFGPVGLVVAYRLTDWVTSTSFIHLLISPRFEFSLAREK